MEKIRVLVVDDSFVVRRVVTDELAAQPDIEVAGTAATGKIALEKLAQLNPDLVILDIEMPEMDGLTALSHLRESHPKTSDHVIADGAWSRSHAGSAVTRSLDSFAKPEERG
jgi:chemotaxis response regulator CheB